MLSVTTDNTSHFLQFSFECGSARDHTGKYDSTGAVYNNCFDMVLSNDNTETNLAQW